MFFSFFSTNLVDKNCTFVMLLASIFMLQSIAKYGDEIIRDGYANVTFEEFLFYVVSVVSIWHICINFNLSSYITVKNYIIEMETFS